MPGSFACHWATALDFTKSVGSLHAMEMLRILTNKLKQQSLNEVQPAKTEEERDSGTESDEEIAELEELAKQMQSAGHPLPSSSSSSPTLSRSFYLVSTSSLSPTHHQPDLTDTRSDQSSTRGSLDFDQNSSDFDAGNWTDGEVERPHSSEDELTVINSLTNSRLAIPVTRGELQAEKRKWSQVAHHNCDSGNDNSGSSDEEVQDFMSHKPQPVLFSSSPPRGVRRCAPSARLFLANVTPCTLCTMSPRKRHRQISSSDVSEGVSVIQRPCLDFEKMQMTLVL